MQSCVSRFIKALIILGIVYYASGSMEESSRNMMINNPYARSLDIDLLTKLLLTPQRLCHPSKRNSEIINALLGLPKNMNNAGK